MIPISLVVSAPDGIGKCLFPDDLLAQIDGQSLEVIIADGSSDYVDRSRPGLRHLAVGTPNVYALKTAGVLAATKEWVLISEDHALAQPGILDAYRESVANHPDIDVFSGTLENFTSTSPWSFAFFLYGDGHRYWSHAVEPPKGPWSANLLVRRSAILASELTGKYGFMLLTMPRLVRADRYRHCPNAVIDHILHLRWWEALKLWVFIAERTTLARRSILRRSPAVQMLRNCAGAIYLPTLGAWRTTLTLRGTPQFGVGMCLRLMTIGVANAVGVFAADFKRLRGTA